MMHTMNLGGGHVLIWFYAIFGANSRAKGEYLQRGFTRVHICTPVLQLKNKAIEKIAVSFILFVII